MKIVMTLLVRDEEDILPANLDFHLSRGVDHILAMDNLSEDGTAAILRDYERRGRLTYIHQPADDYAQSRWVTGMARRAGVEFGADWVINGDADEFWWPDRGDLATTLAAVPPDVLAVQVERSNFLPPPPGDGRPFAAAMTLRERRSLNAMGRPLPPKVCHRALPDLVVEQGNHAVRRGEALLAAGLAPLEILHFPLRSYPQFANKIAKGGAAYARNQELPKGVGETWRVLRENQLRGRLRDDYDRHVLGAEEIEAELAQGRLVLDLRLRDALAELRRERA